jgi:prepilin-type N-terminal cleavage/methylation domain-containing protein
MPPEFHHPPRTATSSRSGFTLVELLVVIAIIGILVALLLPAIQAAREAARRTQCGNNLKQIGVAMHNYHDSIGRFPPGFMLYDASGEEWSWAVFLMPYMEQQALYDQLAPDKRRLRAVIADANDRKLVQTVIKDLLCPSDTVRKLSPRGPYDVHGPADFRPAASSYAAVRGFYQHSATDNRKNNGVFYGESSVAMKDILDGTSHTFAVGEREARCDSVIWCGVRKPGGGDNVSGRVSVKVNHPTGSCGTGFGSNHPGGAQFTMCDASVQFITEDIQFNNNGADPTALSESEFNNKAAGMGAYQWLGVIDDGQTIPEF